MDAMVGSRTRKGRTFALAGAVLTLAMAAPVRADEVAGPVGGQDWYPSKWGADDQAGASNYMGPAKVMQAAALITTGEVYSLGRAFGAGHLVAGGGPSGVIRRWPFGEG